MTREDIIRKCQGLLALSQSGSEAEMLSAAAKLQAWLGKYQLSLSDIQQSDDPLNGFIDRRVDGKYNESWRRTCYSAAAKLFMCDYFFVSIGTKSVGVIHHIIGAEHNAVVAEEMGKYFENTINRLCNEAARRLSREEHTERHRFIRSFRLNAANRVYSRVLEYVKDAKAGRLIDTETGETLPAMLSIYDEADMLADLWLKENGYTIREVKSRDKIMSREGAALGRAAGAGISFSTQISSASAGHALPRA